MQLSDRKAAQKAKFGHPLSRSTLTGSDSVEHLADQEQIVGKDGITLTTETAIVTSTASRNRDEEGAYPHSPYGKPAGAGYSFHVSTKSQGDRAYQQQ